MKVLPPPKTSWFARLGITLVSVVVLVVGFVTASLLFVLLLAIGLVFAAWLWWQARRLTRQAQAAQPNDLEGEYTVESTHLILEDQIASSREPPPSNPTAPPQDR